MLYLSGTRTMMLQLSGFYFRGLEKFRVFERYRQLCGFRVISRLFKSSCRASRPGFIIRASLHELSRRAELQPQTLQTLNRGGFRLRFCERFV